MLEQCKTAYSESRRVRIFVSLGLCRLWVASLYIIGRISTLGMALPAACATSVAPLMGQPGISDYCAPIGPCFAFVVIAHSLAAAAFAAYRVVLYWWHHLHEHEHFAMDLREAERIAEEAVSGKGDAEEDEYTERWQPCCPNDPDSAPAMRPEPTRARQPAYRRHACFSCRRFIGLDTCSQRSLLR